VKSVDLVTIRKKFFIPSAIAMVISLVLLIVPGLRPGIEFTSGTTMLVQFNRSVSQEDIRAAYASLGHPEARVQSSGANQYLIRTRELEVPPGGFMEVAPDIGAALAPTPVGPAPLTELGTVVIGAEDVEEGTEVFLRRPFQGDVCNLGGIAARIPAGTEATVTEINATCTDGTVYRVLVGDDLGYIPAANTHDFVEATDDEEPDSVVTEGQGERTEIEQYLFEQFGSFQVLEFASVSAVVSGVAVRNAAVAVVVASLFIMAYVAFAFATVPRAFRYAASAIAALVHDVVIVLGAFVIFGIVFGTEINLMFVTGLLTVIGFSVHDSIVVFDRIRENVRSAPNATLAENVNSALLQTMARSFNTSVTLLLTVVAMLVLGGVTIREFLLVILVGVSVGTYSSIGIAAQILVAWEEGDFARFDPRKRRAPTTSQTPEATS